MKRNDKGFVYGITFTDHRSEAVFKGSDIGKSYGASAILEMIAKGLNQKVNTVATLLQKQNPGRGLLQKKDRSKEKKSHRKT